VRGLADKATPAAVKLLQKISAGDKDAEIQEEAIHALADLPGRSGLPHLIELVRTHPDASVRTKAVEAIGDVGGPEAVKVLAGLAKGRGR
jgi:HEAT repeat protein